MLPTRRRTGRSLSPSKKVKWLAACLLLLAVGLPAHAQRAMLRGRVVDVTDMQPLGGATVQVQHESGYDAGTSTDEDGYFVLTRLMPGRYALRVSFVGYAPFADTVLVETGGDQVRIALTPTAVVAGEVTVDEPRTDPAPGEGRLVSVRPAEVRGVPTLTPASDLAAYLTTLPAFSPTSDRGGQVSVRGGEPTQNLFLLDGIPVYQPFHVLGEFSIVPGEALAFADVYAGAFPARYGGRIASTIDVTLRSGNKHAYEAHAALAPLLSAVQVEGPLVRGKVSALVSVRESFARRIGPGIAAGKLPFDFGDRLVRLHAYLTQTSSLSATAFQSDDRATLATAMGDAGTVRWKSEGAGMRFSYLPTAYAVLAEIEVFGTRLDSEFSAPGAMRRRSLVEEVGGNFGFRYLLGDSEIRFGIQARTDHLLALEARREREEYLTEGAAYLEGAWRGHGFRVYPGLRVSTFPSRSQVVLEPRLRAEWERGGHLFHAGAALVHQEIGGRYTSADLADVFVAWVPVPEGSPLPQAQQHVAGWSLSGPGGMVGLEAYYRDLQHLGDAGALDGHAQGVEARVEIRRRALTAGIDGALSSVRYRSATAAPFPPPTDRPVRLGTHITGTYRALEASARWTYADGSAYTPLRGTYRRVEVMQGAGYPTDPGTRDTSDGRTGSRRLPATHRLDLVLRYNRTLGPVRLAVQVALRNAYDRANVFYFNRLTGERYNQLPRTLAFGLRLDV